MNTANSHNINVEELGRELGVIAQWKSVARE